MSKIGKRVGDRKLALMLRPVITGNIDERGEDREVRKTEQREKKRG